jgi:tRNA dimethylallyltransferase
MSRTRAAPGLVIVGVTGVGKSALARRLCALVEDLVPINLDAMSVYGGMEVGTASPGREERERLGYRLVGHVPPSRSYSLGQYLRDLEEELTTLGRARPLLVGGTALYARAVVNRMVPPGSWLGLRSWLEGRVAEQPAAWARILGEADPLAAGLDPRNLRRLVRALEVAIGSGRRASVHGDALAPTRPARYPQVGLRADPARYRTMLAHRIEAQLAAGWLEEVAGLRAASWSRTARSAIGYAELDAHLAGELTLEEAKEAILTRTLRFARRQMAWFARDPRIVWVDSIDEGVARAMALLEGA